MKVFVTVINISSKLAPSRQSGSFRVLCLTPMLIDMHGTPKICAEGHQGEGHSCAMAIVSYVVLCFLSVALVL